MLLGFCLWSLFCSVVRSILGFFVFHLIRSPHRKWIMGDVRSIAMVDVWISSLLAFGIGVVVVEECRMQCVDSSIANYAKKQFQHLFCIANSLTPSNTHTQVLRCPSSNFTCEKGDTEISKAIEIIWRAGDASIHSRMHVFIQVVVCHRTYTASAVRTAMV